MARPLTYNAITDEYAENGMIHRVLIGGICDGVPAERVADAVAAGWQVDECNDDGTYRMSSCQGAIRKKVIDTDQPAIVETK